MSFPSLAASNSCLHNIRCASLCLQSLQECFLATSPAGNTLVVAAQMLNAADVYLSSPVACSISSAVMTPEENVLDPLHRVLERENAVTCCTCSVKIRTLLPVKPDRAGHRVLLTQFSTDDAVYRPYTVTSQGENMEHDCQSGPGFPGKCPNTCDVIKVNNDCADDSDRC